MAIGTRPVSVIKWAGTVVNNGPLSGPNRKAYTLRHQDEGWLWKEKPPYEFMNEWQYNMYVHMLWAGDSIVDIDTRVQAVESIVSGTVSKWTFITSTPTALTNGSKYISANMAAGTYTIPLNAAPTNGIEVVIDTEGDASVNNLTISGNGKTINGAANFVIDMDQGVLHLIYKSADNNWILGPLSANLT